MYKMTSYERVSRMFQHQEADRIPIFDHPWNGTIERWNREGMPENVNYVDYFDLDNIVSFGLNITPRYDEITLEETEDYRIYTTMWGTTLKNWKHVDSTPEFIDFNIKTLDDWLKARERMQPSKDRINWSYIKNNYRKWREKGYWIQAALNFGFDMTHSWIVGTERFLIALMENPEWCVDMFNYCLNMNLSLLDMIWEAGYEFDSIFWCDDMGYKDKQFFSLGMYRELLKPVHKRAIDWAHSKGIKAHLHSCGNINPFVPELIGIGLDALNPLEVKAGMNPVELKEKYGDHLVFHGGVNAVLWDDLEAIEAEMRKVIPVMKKSGGYIFSSDHSVPSSVSLENFRYIIEVAKKFGKY